MRQSISMKLNTCAVFSCCDVTKRLDQGKICCLMGKGGGMPYLHPYPPCLVPPDECVSLCVCLSMYTYTHTVCESPANVGDSPRRLTRQRGRKTFCSHWPFELFPLHACTPSHTHTHAREQLHGARPLDSRLFPPSISELVWVISCQETKRASKNRGITHKNRRKRKKV